MVQKKLRTDWSIRLDELGVKERELKERANELEDEIEKLETSLAQDRIRRYRIEILDKLKDDFVNAFRERDNLVEPRFGDTTEWNAYSRRIKACVIIQKALDTEEAGFCGDVPQLNNYLREKINEGLGDEGSEEISYFLNT